MNNKMKKQLLITIGIFSAFAGISQHNLQNPRNRTGKADSVIDIREKLVQLAMQNPGAEVDDRNIAVSEYVLKNTKSAVLSSVVLQGNLNEYSINGSTTTQGSIYYGQYPRYNLGVTLPLGLFTTRTRDIHIANENIGINIALKNDHYRVLREAVLSKYEDYLMTNDLLILQNQLVEDVYTVFQKVEKNYADAKIQSEDYTNAYRSYNVELAKQRVLERDLRRTELEIERYIGVKLETVLAQYKKK
jgi:outer membrane protein TolC